MSARHEVERRLRIPRHPRIGRRREEVDPERPVRSGAAFRVNGPPHNIPVRPELADELERIFERFAREAGFDRHFVKPIAVDDLTCDLRGRLPLSAGSHAE